MVIQVNGKTRDVISIKKDMTQTDINKLILKSSKANKHLICLLYTSDAADE